MLKDTKLCMMCFRHMRFFDQIIWLMWKDKMAFIMSWMFKNMVKSMMDGDEKDGSQNTTIVDTYEKLEKGISDMAHSTKKFFTIAKCKSVGCKERPIDGATFCKYHKCEKCDKKRAAGGSNLCIQHKYK